MNEQSSCNFLHFSCSFFEFKENIIHETNKKKTIVSNIFYNITDSYSPPDNSFLDILKLNVKNVLTCEIIKPRKITTRQLLRTVFKTK